MISGMMEDRGIEKTGFLLIESNVTEMKVHNSTYWMIEYRIDKVYGPEKEFMNPHQMMVRIFYRCENNDHYLTIGINQYTEEVIDPGPDGLLELRVSYVGLTNDKDSVDEGDLIRITGLPGSSEFIDLTFTQGGDDGPGLLESTRIYLVEN